MEAVLAELQARLGADRVLTDPEVLAGRAVDTWPLALLRRRTGPPPVLPLCVVRPRSTAEVAAALRILTAAGVAVVPRGGGSGVVGGAAAGWAPAPVAVLDVGALDQILDLSPTDLTATVQAGVVLGRLEEWLAERGYTTGHYPQSIALAQVGGLVATRSAGQFSTRYSTIADMVTGLEAVLAGGQVVRLRALPRWAAGPDLRQVLIGSEGCLGVITEVTLQVHPIPPARWQGAFAFPDLEAGLAAVAACLRAGWRPAVVRLYDPVESGRQFGEWAQPGECVLLLLSEGPAGYVAAEAAALREAMAAGRPLGPDPMTAWLAHRNDVRLFYELIAGGVLVDTIEVAAGWSRLGPIYRDALRRLQAGVPGLMAASAHVSHCYPQGANLYFTLAAAPGPEPEAVERASAAMWAVVMAATLAAGGHICHHHGIGRVRAGWLPVELGSGYPLLRALKGALDPQGLLNPGALLAAGPPGPVAPG